MQILNFSSGQRVAAAAGMAIAIAQVALMDAPSAHAETGSIGYAQCVGGDTKPPPPGVNAEFWFPSVHVITNDFDGGVPPNQITAILIGMGVNPTDAAKRVQCFMANQPRGIGY